jgi:hypothetical protein
MEPSIGQQPAPGQERATSLQPFLFIAAISATRRILAIGAQMSVTGDTLSSERFRQVMIDLSANVSAIPGIAVALYLLSGRSIVAVRCAKESRGLKLARPPWSLRLSQA